MAIPTWSDEQKKNKLGLDNFLLETVEKKNYQGWFHTEMSTSKTKQGQNKQYAWVDADRSQLDLLPILETRKKPSKTR